VRRGTTVSRLAAMAAIAISCSSGCVFKIRSIQDESRFFKHLGTLYQDISHQLFMARLNIFTLVCPAKAGVFS
jgi:hypothetical protein